MRYVALLITLMTVISVFSACSHQEDLDGNSNDSSTLNQELKGEYNKISPDEAKSIIDNQTNYIIVDVRTQQEYDEGHIKDAILISDVEIRSRAPKELKDKSQKILVYCRSGRRSKSASEMLVSLGYTQVYDFGGIIDWNYDIVK